MRKQIACLLFCLCFTVNLLHAQETTSKINWFVGNTAAGHYRFTSQLKADLPNQTLHFEIFSSFETENLNCEIFLVKKDTTTSTTLLTNIYKS